MTLNIADSNLPECLRENYGKGYHGNQTWILGSTFPVDDDSSKRHFIQSAEDFHEEQRRLWPNWSTHAIRYSGVNERFTGILLNIIGDTKTGVLQRKTLGSAAYDVNKADELILDYIERTERIRKDGEMREANRSTSTLEESMPSRP